MAFWIEKNTEPKRVFRWTLTLPTIGQQWICKSVQRPSWETSVHPHKYINHEDKYPGRVTWNPISIVLVDPVTPVDTTATMLAILRASGYDFPTGEQRSRSTITKALATSAIGSPVIEMHGQDAHGSLVLDSWILVNAFPTTVTLGDLNYDGDELLEINMTLAYDYAYMGVSGGTDPGWQGHGTDLSPIHDNPKDTGDA